MTLPKLLGKTIAILAIFVLLMGIVPGAAFADDVVVNVDPNNAQIQPNGGGTPVPPSSELYLNFYWGQRFYSSSSWDSKISAYSTSQTFNMDWLARYTGSSPYEWFPTIYAGSIYEFSSGANPKSSYAAKYIEIGMVNKDPFVGSGFNSKNCLPGPSFYFYRSFTDKTAEVTVINNDPVRSLYVTDEMATKWVVLKPYSSKTFTGIGGSGELFVQLTKNLSTPRRCGSVWWDLPFKKTASASNPISKGNGPKLEVVESPTK